VSTVERTAALEDDAPVLTGEFAALLAASLAFGLAHSAYFLLPKFLAIELHADASEIGGYSSVTWFANVALVAFVGVWIDRRGRLPLAFAGAALMALTGIGFLGVDALGPWLVCLRIAHGFAFTLFFVATSTLAADLAPPRRLGRALGLFGAMMVSTNALAPAAAEWLANTAGWSAVFAATAVMAALSGLLLLAVRERPHSRGEAREIPGLRSVFARPGLGPVLIASALAGVTFGAMFTFHQPYALSLGITRVSDFLVAYSIAAVIVRGLLGGVADRLGRRQVARFALAVYGVSPIAMVLLGATGFSYIGALLGLAHGLFYPALNALIVEGAEDDVRGKLMAVYNGAFNVGFSIGSLALGYVAEVEGYGLVFTLGGVCSFAALALLARRAPRLLARSAPDKESS
jgi:MFS family permease